MLYQRFHRAKCESAAVTSKLPAEASEKGRETPVSDQKKIAEPPRTADLLSLMRQQFATAVPGEEQEEEEGSGQTASATSFNFDNRQGRPRNKQCR